MGDGHNFVLVAFEDDGKAYEAMSKLKQAGRAGRINVISADLVERDVRGRISVPEADDTVIGSGIAGGGLLGLLVGVLGGPVGVVVGLGAGALAGSYFDVRRAEREEDVLDVIADTIPLGHTALLAELDEYAVEVLDGEMAMLGGIVLRIPAAELLADIEAAEEAARAAEDAVRRVMHEQCKQQRMARLQAIRADWDQRLDALKQKLDVQG